MGWAQLGSMLYAVLAGGIGSAVALFGIVSSRFGDRLFDHALNRKIEVFKHGLEREIEELRARLGRMSDRGIRSNEREYNAIVAAWEAFVDAYLGTMSCIARFDQHADLNRMDDVAFEEWAKNMSIQATDTKIIREASDRNHMYGRYLQTNAINNALRANFEARQCVRKQGIFIPRDLEAKFQGAIDMMSMVHTAQRAELDGWATEHTRTQTYRFMEEGQQIYDALKDAARERLMYDETVQPAAH